MILVNILLTVLIKQSPKHIMAQHNSTSVFTQIKFQMSVTGQQATLLRPVTQGPRISSIAWAVESSTGSSHPITR